MRRRTASLAAVAGLLALAGCGSEEPAGAPAACVAGADAYITALEGAPGEVTLEDGTPISACLTDEQGAGQIADVGGAMLGAAKRLNREAREDPLGDAGTQLGYLVGAVTSRAQDTGGIHQDLALNLEAAATFIGPDEVLPGGFQRRYEEGLAAGRADG